jgi:hypothetical protein
MREIKAGIIMNGVTGRMGTNHHLLRSPSPMSLNREHWALACGLIGCFPRLFFFRTPAMLKNPDNPLSEFFLVCLFDKTKRSCAQIHGAFHKAAIFRRKDKMHVVQFLENECLRPTFLYIKCSLPNFVLFISFAFRTTHRFDLRYSV